MKGKIVSRSEVITLCSPPLVTIHKESASSMLSFTSSKRRMNILAQDAAHKDCYANRYQHNHLLLWLMQGHCEAAQDFGKQIYHFGGK